MDGGICSQIHFFLIGQIFVGKGYKVKYDVSWFENIGKDINGEMERTFDLLKLFPYLDFPICSSFERWMSLKFFLYENDYNDLVHPLKYIKLGAPLYLRGYFRDPDWLYSSLNEKLCLHNIPLDNENLNLLKWINSKTNSVAVHVRRGDLSYYRVAYGNPASVDYFVNAITYIGNRYSDSYYFFFSDEPDWVRKYLIKAMPLNNNYHIIDINGSAKGYIDLLLISSCKHQITSKGSLAKYGALFAQSKNQIVTLCDDETEYAWKRYLSNAILIKC